MLRFSLGKKTDEELMQLVADGNSNALTELYNRYSPKLVRYFFRMLWKDDAKAQDFLHDLFLKLINNPRHFSTERKFSTWIYSVAHNMCKNEYRKQSFRKSEQISLVENTVIISGDKVVDEEDFRQLLDKALSSLDDEDKNLYALRFEIEMPLEEISVMLQCPVGTVKSRLFSLKKKVAGQLSADHPKKIKYGIQ
jgi:RNA polymerase sigma-70 factor, ECF subfamily